MHVVLQSTTMPRRRALTVEQAAALIEEECCDFEDGPADVVILPPDNQVDSDVDECDDDAVGNDVVVNDVPGEVEIHIGDVDENELSDAALPSDDFAPSPVPLHRNWTDRYQKTVSPEWKDRKGHYTKMPSDGNHHEDQLEVLIQEFLDSSPLQTFEKIFDDDVIELFVNETNRYALQCNDPSFCVTASEMKAFIGILVFSGYHQLPSQEHYWSVDPDLGVNIVRESMPAKAFLKIKKYFHCQDNSLINDPTLKDDRSFKVKPFFDLLNKKFQKFGYFHQKLSIDEMMVKYYGHHGLKQFMRGKPVRFGYKLWALCASDGYLYSFSLYQGKEHAGTTKNIPLGARVVLDLASNIDNVNGKELFFDNFFTSPSLLITLRDLGLRATGTIRSNRTNKAPFVEDKKMKERGKMDVKFDESNEVLFVKWNDNNFVHVATNHSDIEPIREVRRFSASTKSYVKVQQPRVIDEYNTSMGGVDHHDWLTSHYAIGVRGKKWYFSLITRGIQMAVVNSWIVFNLSKPTQEKVPLLSFIRDIATSYMKITHGQSSLMSRKRKMPPRRLPAPGSFRFDNTGHYMESRANQRRCQGDGCTARPLTFCKKCDVTLCKLCFPTYHS